MTDLPLPPAVPCLRTERLVVTLPQADMASAMAEYVRLNVGHFAPYAPPRPPDYTTKEFWRAQIARINEEFRHGVSARFVLLGTTTALPELVGECNLTAIVRGPFQSCFLGYNLDHRAVGKGLMTEALRAVIPYAFDTLKLHRIAANYVPTNERSGRVLRRLGFIVEGYGRDYLFLNGAWQDHVLTALLNPTFRMPPC